MAQSGPPLPGQKKTKELLQDAVFPKDLNLCPKPHKSMAFPPRADLLPFSILLPYALQVFFFGLCWGRSNQIRREQQRQDQTTSEELRIVWSKAKQYRNNSTSLHVIYAL